MLCSTLLLAGNIDYIFIGKNSGATPATVATSDDYIAYNQLSSNDINK